VLYSSRRVGITAKLSYANSKVERFMGVYGVSSFKYCTDFSVTVKPYYLAERETTLNSNILSLRLLFATFSTNL